MMMKQKNVFVKCVFENEKQKNEEETKKCDLSEVKVKQLCTYLYYALFAVVLSFCQFIIKGK
jgi:hypothetical protein